MLIHGTDAQGIDGTVKRILGLPDEDGEDPVPKLDHEVGQHVLVPEGVARPVHARRGEGMKEPGCYGCEEPKPGGLVQSWTGHGRLDELELAGGEHKHAQEQPAVPPALDVRRAVGAVPVADRHVHDLQVQVGGSEKQVEIPEWVEIPEEGAVGDDPFVIGAPEDLGPAKGVLERLAQDPGEEDAECLVRAHVQEPHRRLFHGVDEPGAVGEFGAAADHGLVELGHLLRGDGEVRVQDDEEVAFGDREAGADGVALAAAGLLQGLDSFARVGLGDPDNFLPGIVPGVSLDKDELCARAHLGGALHGGLDVAGLVAGGDDDGYGQGAGLLPAHRAGHAEDRKVEPGQQGANPAVQCAAQPKRAHRAKYPGLDDKGLPIGEGEESHHVLVGEPVACRVLRLYPEQSGEGKGRPPEGRRVVDDEPGAGMGMLVQALKHLLDVGGEIERVGDEDAVEALAEIEGFGRLDVELASGRLLAGAGDLALRKIYAHPPARLYQPQEAARAAADLEDGSIRGNQQVVVVGQHPAVAERNPAGVA